MRLSPSYPRRALYLGWGLLLAFVGLVVWHAVPSVQEPCPVPLQEHAVNGKLCPRLGNMNGVKLAIPQHYLLGPTTYKGIDIWNAESFKNRPTNPTFANEIDNFAIKIRLSTFKPIETRKDRDDYAKLGAIVGVPSADNRWIHVGFDRRDYIFCRGSMKCRFDRWLLDEAGRGPWSLQPTKAWGLAHYRTTRVVDKNSMDSEATDLYYDPESQGTFITCFNGFAIAPPYTPRVSCKHQFSIHEAKVEVVVDNIQSDADMARWAEIEREVKRVFQSFVVP